MILHLMFLFCNLCIGRGFYKYEVGDNCPTDHIIVNADSCEIALEVLGLRISNLNVNKADRPAGCYCSTTGKGFFNSFKF